MAILISMVVVLLVPLCLMSAAARGPIPRVSETWCYYEIDHEVKLWGCTIQIVEIAHRPIDSAVCLVLFFLTSQTNSVGIR